MENLIIRANGIIPNTLRAMVNELKLVSFSTTVWRVLAALWANLKVFLCVDSSLWNFNLPVRVLSTTIKRNSEDLVCRYLRVIHSFTTSPDTIEKDNREIQWSGVSSLYWLLSMHTYGIRCVLYSILFMVIDAFSLSLLFSRLRLWEVMIDLEL